MSLVKKIEPSQQLRDRIARLPLDQRLSTADAAEVMGCHTSTASPRLLEAVAFGLLVDETVYVSRVPIKRFYRRLGALRVDA